MADEDRLRRDARRGRGPARRRLPYAPRGVRHGPLSYPVGCRVVTIVRGRDFVDEFDGS